MTRIRATLIACAFAVPLFTGTASAADKSLYLRLGGYDAIAAVTDDFLQRLMTDDKFKDFFVGMSTDTKMRVRQNIVDFFCQLTGGPCYYVGRTMKVSHTGLGISEDLWKLSTVHFVESLNKFNVPAQEQKDFAALVLPLEKDIVDQP